MVTIKKYSNRRLYDTSASQYITLEELADKIREGTDVQVVHAKTDEDITQQILAQIILESRGAARLLPVPLLMRLIRMGEDSLAEFFGQFMSWSLEMYLRFKEGAETMGPYNPFGNGFGKGFQNGMFSGPEAFFRMFMNQSSWNGSAPWSQGSETEPAASVESAPESEPPPEPEPPETVDGESAEPPADDVEELRDEIDELKEIIQGMARQQNEGGGEADSQE